MNRSNWKKAVVVLLVAGLVCLLASHSSAHAQSMSGKKMSGSGARAGKKNSKGGGSSVRKSKGRGASSMRKSGARKSASAKKSKGRGASAMRMSGARKPATAKKNRQPKMGQSAKARPKRTGNEARARWLKAKKAREAQARKDRLAQARKDRLANARKDRPRNTLAKANKGARRSDRLGTAGRTGRIDGRGGRGAGTGGGGGSGGRMGANPLGEQDANGGGKARSAARKALEAEADSGSVAGLDRLGVVDGDPVDEGLEITDIAPGSPAERAGLVIGDVIETVDNNPIASLDDLNDVLEAAGDTIRLRYIEARTGDEQTIRVSLNPLE